MKTGKVVGNLVSTVKHETHEGLKLMIVQPVDHDGEPYGDTVIAADAACAGIGDYVLFSDEGGASRMIIGNGAIIDTVIVGVLDYFPR